MSTASQRARRRAKGLPNWRIVRYADDFVVLVHGTQADAEALREEIARVLAPLGLRLSPAKTRVVHMSEGFDFLGFRIQWKRKRGTNKWYVYTFIADRPIRSVKAKIRALTHRTSQQDLRYVLTRLNQIMRGWANYFRHAVCKHTFGMLDHFAWWRVIRVAEDAAPLEMEGRPPGLHHPARAVAADHGGRDRAVQPGSACRSPGTATAAARSPAPGSSTTPDGRNRGEPGARRRRTPGSASGPGKRTGSNPGTAPRADSTGQFR